MSGQDYGQLTWYQVVSRANLTALPERDWEKKTTETYGLNLCGLSENCVQEPLLVKMCRACYLPYMTAFAPTWKEKTTKCGRSVYRLTLSVPTMRDIGWLLLPSTRASQDYKPIRCQTPQEHCKKHGNTLASGLGIISPELIGQHINPRFSEWLMGFPEGWTDV